jgi:hypothetical protein
MTQILDSGWPRLLRACMRKEWRSSTGCLARIRSTQVTRVGRCPVSQSLSCPRPFPEASIPKHETGTQACKGGSPMVAEVVPRHESAHRMSVREREQVVPDGLQRAAVPASAMHGIVYNRRAGERVVAKHCNRDQAHGHGRRNGVVVAPRQRAQKKVLEDPKDTSPVRIVSQDPITVACASRHSRSLHRIGRMGIRPLLRVPFHARCTHACGLAFRRTRRVSPANKTPRSLLRPLSQHNVQLLPGIRACRSTSCAHRTLSSPHARTVSLS